MTERTIIFIIIAGALVLISLINALIQIYKTEQQKKVHLMEIAETMLVKEAADGIMKIAQAEKNQRKGMTENECHR